MGWARDLDMLGPRTPPWWGSWILLLAAVVTAISLLSQREELLARQASIALRIDRLSAHRAGQGGDRSGPARADDTPDLAVLEEATRLVDDWNHPWEAVLVGVEVASGPKVALLHLGHRSPEAAVDIEAAVVSDDEAWRFVQALGKDTDRFREVKLLSREPLTPVIAGFAVRIRLQARLAKVPDVETVGQRLR